MWLAPDESSLETKMEEYLLLLSTFRLRKGVTHGTSLAILGFKGLLTDCLLLLSSAGAFSAYFS